MAKWNVSYEYVSPHGAGPFRGRQVVESCDKPEKGQTFYAMMGWARIKTVSRVRETLVLWGLHDAHGTLPLKIASGNERDCRAALKQRQAEGWRGLAILPEGEAYVEPRPPAFKACRDSNGASFIGLNVKCSI